MSCIAWMIEAAAARRRRRPAQAQNWITDASAPIGWGGENDALVAMAARINEPLHRRLSRPLERIAEVQISAAGSDTG